MLVAIKNGCVCVCKYVHALVGFSMQIKYAMEGEKQNYIE